MQHSPAEYFIKYLCSRPRSTPAEVRNFLANAGIGIMPSSTYVDDLYAEVTSKFPINYNPEDTTHKPSQLFLKEEKIRGMWQPTHSVKEATDIFSNGPVREIVETLLLTGIIPEQISEILAFYKSVNVLPSAIIEYKHFFWNVDLLNQEEWAEYLTSPSIKPLKLTALRSPRNRDGVRLTLYKMGIMPKSMDKMAVFTSIRDIGFMNFLEANGFPQGRHKAEMLGNYSNVVTQSQRQLDEYEAGEQDVIAAFYKNMSVTSHNIKHKTLDELRGEDGEQGTRKLPSGGDG